MRLLRSEAPPPIFFIAFLSFPLTFSLYRFNLYEQFHHANHILFIFFVHCIHHNFQFFPVSTKNYLQLSHFCCIFTTNRILLNYGLVRGQLSMHFLILCNGEMQRSEEKEIIFTL